VEPVNQWIETFDGALEGLLMNGLVEKMGAEDNDTTIGVTNERWKVREMGIKEDIRVQSPMAANKIAYPMYVVINIVSRSVVEYLMYDGPFSESNLPAAVTAVGKAMKEKENTKLWQMQSKQ
jgi:hypothetical protein